jgi:hypothetical protein
MLVIGEMMLDLGTLRQTGSAWQPIDHSEFLQPCSNVQGQPVQRPMVAGRFGGSSTVTVEFVITSKIDVQSGVYGVNWRRQWALDDMLFSDSFCFASTVLLPADTHDARHVACATL